MPMALQSFAAKHPLQGPNKPHDAEDELRKLTEEDGVVLLSSSPFPEPVPGNPGYPEGRHLWVILPERLPVLQETAPRVRPPPLQSVRAKHTNLTGGDPACCGGELWIDAASPDLLYVNGGSGRYQPRSPAELADVVQVFEGIGYRVVSAGWDEDNDKPARVFRQP
ncbi:MAG TPA: hypothetical protein VLS89_05150 [Candidatus Nanopelagicales bacterium]|nr:hypothetical protein [Candidatus Nanopelagicales bacterium]